MCPEVPSVRFSILNQMKVAEGHTYTAQEGAQIEMELIDLRADKAVVSLQVKSTYTLNNGSEYLNVKPIKTHHRIALHYTNLLDSNIATRKGEVE